MDQLEELFKQMQELAGVGLDMLQGAKGGGKPEGGPPGGPPGGAPDGPPPGGAPDGPPRGGGDGPPKDEDKEKGGNKPPPFGR